MAIRIADAQRSDDLVQGHIALPGVVVELCAFPEVEPETVVVKEQQAILSLGLSRLMAGSFGRVAGSGRAPFVRFGALGFRPAGVPMEMHVSGGAFHTLRCRFEEARIRQALGPGPLDEAALAACFDIRSQAMEDAMLRLAVEVDQPQTDSAAVAQALVTILLIDLKRYLAGAMARIHRHRGGLTPRMLRRVLELVDAAHDRTLTVADLAACAGVSERALHATFRRELGTTPMGYLRTRRLEAVREDLLAAEPGDGVTEIALRHGFSHLGRFAAAYRVRFGEAPSSTLRR